MNIHSQTMYTAENLNKRIQFKVHITSNEVKKNVHPFFAAMIIGCCAVCQFDFMSFENQRQVNSEHLTVNKSSSSCLQFDAFECLVIVTIENSIINVFM